MKLNKKGFTLVELLAVIVVLALLMVVATSSIGKALKNSKKAALKTEAQKMLTTLYEEGQSEKVLGNLTTTTTGTSLSTGNGEFTYGYTLGADGAVSNFCMKDKNSYYATGKVDIDGNITVDSIKESKPSSNTNCP